MTETETYTEHEKGRRGRTFMTTDWNDAQKVKKENIPDFHEVEDDSGVAEENNATNEMVQEESASEAELIHGEPPESPFLGDEPSVHFNYKSSSANITFNGFPLHAVLMKIPSATCPYNLINSMQDLSPYEWMLPYVVAGVCCIPSMRKSEKEAHDMSNDMILEDDYFVGGTPSRSPTMSPNSSSLVDQFGWLMNSHNNSKYISSQQSSTAPIMWLGNLAISTQKYPFSWDTRIILLMNNYLFEYAENNENLIGYCPLCDADITMITTQTFSPSATDNSMTNILLQISYLLLCREDSDRETFYIKCNSIEDAEKLRSQLLQAANLTINDIYDVDDKEESLLSKGRATEVRVACRKMSNVSVAAVATACSELTVPPPPPPTSSSSSALSFTSSTSPQVNGNSRKLSVSRRPYWSFTDSAKATARKHSISMDMHRSSSLPPALEVGHQSSSSIKSLSSGGGGGGGGGGGTSSPNGSGSYYENREFALKLVNRENYAKRVENGSERADSLVRELLSQIIVCQHAKSLMKSETEIPIVQVYGAFETLKSFAIEMELMQSEDLDDKLKVHGPFAEKDVKRIVSQLCDAIMLCRTAGVVHRDIKPSNITVSRVRQINSSSTSSSSKLFHSKSPIRDYSVKLADFGMAGFIGDDGFARGRCGTLGYVAPEIVCSGLNEGYTTTVDLFSLAVTAYKLLCGQEPFPSKEQEVLVALNKQAHFSFDGGRWSKVSDEAKRWIMIAGLPDPVSRFSSPEIASQDVWLAQSSTMTSGRYFRHRGDSSARQPHGGGHHGTCVIN